MALTRRQFLTLSGGSAGAAILFAACGVPEDELLVEAPVQMPEDMVSGRDNWYATLCRECGTSEGIVVRVMEGRARKIEGNVDYPLNAGKHSARCEAGLQALYNPDRIRGPLVRAGERGTGQFEEISWTDAIGRLTFHLQNVQRDRGQRGVIFATNPVGGRLGSVVDSFASSYGAKRMTYEPLESANLKTAMKTVFGQDSMPDFDIENSSFILSFGADFLNTWGSPTRYGRAYGKFRQGRLEWASDEFTGDRERGTHYHVDSRFSMTAANADKWIPVKPGTEGLLALSIAQELAHHADEAVVEALTDGNPAMLDAYAADLVADQIGVSAEKIADIAHALDEHPESSLVIGGGSAGAHTNGLANLQAIYSLNLLLGSVERDGGVKFNPAPPLEGMMPADSPNAMSDWRDAIADMRAGKVSTLLLRGANPFYGLPASLDIQDASYDVPFIASFSDIMDDSTLMADLILPQHTAFEDWGSDSPDFGPGYQLVGFQQPVVKPFFENRGSELGTRGFADVLLTVAQGLNLNLGLGGDTFEDILRSDAQKLYEMGRGSVSAATFGGFWNGVLQRGGWWDTSTGYAGGVSRPAALTEYSEPEMAGDGYDFYLTPFATAGIGAGDGAHLPWMQALPDPITTAAWRTWAEINYRVAENLGIREGDVIRVTSPRGSIEALAFPHPGAPPDTISIPFGQGHNGMGRYAKNRGANVFSILAPLTDADSGALAWAATKVNIEKTGEWVRVPKFENTVPDFPRDNQSHVPVIQITSEDS